MADFDLAGLTPEVIELHSLKLFWPSSYCRQIDDLTESIKQAGLIRPLWVWKKGPDHLLLAGQQRREALWTLGRNSAPALVIPENWSPDKILLAALLDNQQRGWNQAETALLWRFLTDELGEEKSASLSFCFGLGQSPKLRQWCLMAATLSEKGLVALANGQLDLECGARLAPWEAENQRAVLDLFEALSPSKHKKKHWLDWLEDVSRREKITAAQILQAPEIQAALGQAERLGRPAAEEAARRYLWGRRHPLLAELSAERQVRLRSLRLPRAARLELDPTFEDLKFSLELTFSTPAEFYELAGVIENLRQSPDFKKLLDDSND